MLKMLRQAFHSSFLSAALLKLIKDPLQCVLCLFSFVNLFVCVGYECSFERYKTSYLTAGGKHLCGRFNLSLFF